MTKFKTIKHFFLLMLFTSLTFSCNDDDVSVDPEPEVSVFETMDRRASQDAMIAALNAASGNLSQILSGDQEYTVFAPTSDAFSDLAVRLGFDNYNAMIAEIDIDILDEILSYHIVAGESLAGSLSDGQELEALSTEIITISISDNLVQLLDETDFTTTNGTVVEPDITATNGVLHIIDSVLLSDDIIARLDPD